MVRWLVLPVVVGAATWLVPDTPHDPHIAGHSREVARIQRHFDSVLVELRAADAHHLAPAQLSNRQRLIATLSGYRQAGRFPHNYDFPGHAVPYFVDRHTRVRCAVAFLLDATGRDDIVARVAASDNNVWVSQLAGDTAFTAWLGDQGITLAEAARIQVPYIDDGNPIVATFGSRSGAYAVAAASAALPALATTWWNARGNADGHRTLGTVLGFTTSAMSLGVATMALQNRDAPGYVAPLTLASGGLAAWFAGRGFARHRDAVAANNRQRTESRVSVAPLMPTSQSGAGVAVRLTF